MQEKNNDELLKKELQKKLDWYTMYATEEEYSQEDVEHISYLLDSLDPLEEGEIPSVEESWGRLCQMCENPRELLPLEREVPLAIGEGKTEADTPGSYKKSTALNKGKGKIIKFMLCHKAIVAALFLVMVLAVGGSIQAGAIKNSGFFFWLKRDETGTDIFTSPDTLDVEANNTKNVFYMDRNDMPEWTREWLEIEAEFVAPENYEWQYYEINELDFIRNIISHYLDEELNQEILLGIYIYTENVLYNRDGFANYKYVDSYNVDYGQMDVYCKTEETGEIFYAICFYEGNCQYTIWNYENLKELKKLAEQYWNCVKNNM